MLTFFRNLFRRNVPVDVQPHWKLETYPDQVVFLRRMIREGRCKKIGTWQRAGYRGDMWFGEGFGLLWWFSTDGQKLVKGSFRMRSK